MRETQRSKSFCQNVKSDRGRCRARPVSGSPFCFFHDPAKGQEREAAQRAGGLRNKLAVLPSTTPDAVLVTGKDVVQLLGKAINQVLRGEIDPKVANAVGYLGGLLMKAIHETELEVRLAALERAVEREPPTPEFVLDDDWEHSAEVRKNGNN